MKRLIPGVIRLRGGPHDLGLEKSGDGEEDRQAGDAGHVLEDALGEGVGLVHGLAIIERVMNRDESLQRDGHRHEDGGGDGHLIERIQ